MHGLRRKAPLGAAAALASALVATPVATLVAMPAVAQPAAPAAGASMPLHAMKEDAPRTGSMIRRETVRNALIPFDKRYEELTAEERAIVRSWYESMPEADEPPFPLHGTGRIYKRIAEAQRRLVLNGFLSMFVTVDSTGTPTAVSVLSTPDPGLARYVAGVLLEERYKPAVCSGRPCEMQFPVRITLQREL